jgi:hypothetical protein
MTTVVKARQQAERAEAQAKRARQHLYEAIRGAVAVGESVNLVAEAAGLSRQRVWQVVKAGNSRRGRGK